MSRASVFTALTTDPELNGMGIREDTVFPNFSMDQRPYDHGPFLVLRWEEQAYGFRSRRGPRVLTIWSHIPKQIANDFGDIDVILDRVEDVLSEMEHVTGADGYTVTSVRATGKGSDNFDPGYDTIVRNAAFEILSRRSTM